MKIYCPKCNCDLVQVDTLPPEEPKISMDDLKMTSQKRINYPFLGRYIIHKKATCTKCGYTVEFFENLLQNTHALDTTR